MDARRDILSPSRPIGLGADRDARPRIGWRSLLMVFLLSAALGMTACSDDAEGPAVDPTVVLGEAVPAMEALSSFAFTYEVVVPESVEPPQGTTISRITGAVTSDGRMKAVIDLLTRGIPLQIEFVADGETHYIKDPAGQQWQSLPATMSPVGRLDLSAGAIQVLQQVDDAQYAGREDLDGVPVHHITGSVDAVDVASIAGATTTSEPFPAAVWIGVDDHLVRRIELEGAATDSEDPETVRVISLTGFDEPVTIEPPQ